MQVSAPPPPITPENPTGSNIPPQTPYNQPLIKNNPLSWIVRLIVLGIIISSFIRGGLKTTQVKILPSSPTPSTINNPANWKVYIDELETYQIQAPTDWEWITHSSNFQNMHFITLKAPDNSVFQSSAEEIKNQDLAGYLSQRDETNATGWEGQPSKRIISTKNISVGNYPGMERVEEWLAADYVTVVTYFKAGNYVYEFSIQPGEVDYLSTDVHQFYYQILSSFKLKPVSPTGVKFESGCKTGGCSGELCLDAKSEDIASICIYREEWACYKYAVCEKQSDGNCAWTQTPQYQSCIAGLRQ